MYHEPVLCKEAVEYLVTKEDGIYVDGTTGGGGHSLAILSRLNARGRLFSLDMDDAAIKMAGAKLSSYGERSRLIKTNFKNFDSVLQAEELSSFDGLLLDLGVSSRQIDDARRGFSFSKEGQLDMRMDCKQKISAFEIVNTYSKEQLERIIREYGEERRHAAVSAIIIKERERRQIATTEQLVNVVSKALSPAHRIKSLARIFQALRIAVNHELQNLTTALCKSLDYLSDGGRIVVLSYHSLEDRITKRFFKEQASRCDCPPELPVCICNKQNRLEILTKRAITPGAVEISANPRSRSAKLRAAKHIAEHHG